MLRRMIGQPIIMVVMLTFGIELLLRGAVPGLLGSAVKRLSLGIPQAPVFLGDMLINRAYLIGGGVSAALHYRRDRAASTRAPASSCARSPTTRGRPGRSASASSARLRSPGGSPAIAATAAGDSLGQHARRRLEPVVASDEGACHRHPRRARQHSGRAGRRRHRRASARSLATGIIRSADRRRHARHRRVGDHRDHTDGPPLRPVRPRTDREGADVLPPRRHPPSRLPPRTPAMAAAVRSAAGRHRGRCWLWRRRSSWTGFISSPICCRG